MKKLFFVALAVIAMMASCTEEPKVPTISNVKYAPETILADQDVTVTATIAGEAEFTAKVVYAINGDKGGDVVMTAGEQNVYTGIIPGQANGTKVTFFVQVTAGDVVIKTDVYEYEVGEIVPPTPAERGLILNELSGVNKFIELYNDSDENIVLENCYIEKDAKDAPVWVGDGSITVPAHGYVVLWSEDVIEADHPELDGTNYVFASGLSSKKTVRIALFKGEFPNGEQIDIFTRGEAGEEGWGLTISDVKPKVYARTPDCGDWKLADETPGAANPAEGNDIPQD